MAALKKKKLTAQFCDEFIDNTAPIKKIFDDLFYKNYQAFELYTMALKQRMSSKWSATHFHYTTTGHPLYAFPEDWDGHLNNQYFENFDYRSLMPYFLTPLVNCQQPDPITESMRIKMDWLNTCKQYNFVANFPIAPRHECLNEEVTYCPKVMIDMAAHLEREPDPHFDEAYNWHYAGNGNLQLITVHDLYYLLHSEFHYLYLSEFSKDDLCITKHNVCQFNCGDANNILETIFLNSIVVLRTLYKIFILKVSTSGDNNVTMEAIRVMESKISFTGINFDMYHKNILYVSSLDNRIQIVNLDRMKSQLVKTEKKELLNNWNTVIGCERMTFLHVGRTSISCYDKRTKAPVHQWKNLKMIIEEKFCNNITAATGAVEDASIYFTTDHHLFLMDLRKMCSKPSVVQRWTHGMQCAPTYMAACHFENAKELVCMSSQWCEDMCVVPNYRDRLNMHGVTVPYRPPSVLTVLAEAWEKRCCWDIYNLIENRLCTSISGLAVMEQNNKYVVLMQNSMGDITSHVIYPEYMDVAMEDDAVSKLRTWSSGYKANDKVFEVSAIRDISCIFRRLKRIPEDHIILAGSIDRCNFSEKELEQTFECDEVDNALLDIWKKT